MIKYNEKHINWLKENGMKYYIKELTKTFNQTFGTNYKDKSIAETMRYRKLPRKIKTPSELGKAYIKYTEAHMQWVRENIHKYSQKDLCEKFNKTFNMDTTIKTFHSILSKHGIRTRTTPSIKYTKEQTDWIINNHINYNENYTFNLNKFTEDFNKEFNTNKNKYHLSAKIRLMGIKKPKAVRTNIGHSMKIHGQWSIKVDDIPSKGILNYRKKANVLYEQYHNTQVDDLTETVIHLNNDVNDFNKDNLYKISLNAYRRYKTVFNSQTLETKLNALKVCEIIQLIKEIE